MYLIINENDSKLDHHLIAWDHIWLNTVQTHNENDSADRFLTVLCVISISDLCRGGEYYIYLGLLRITIF